MGLREFKDMTTISQPSWYEYKRDYRGLIYRLKGDREGKAVAGTLKEVRALPRLKSIARLDPRPSHHSGSNVFSEAVEGPIDCQGRLR